MRKELKTWRFRPIVPIEPPQPAIEPIDLLGPFPTRECWSYCFQTPPVLQQPATDTSNRGRREKKQNKQSFTLVTSLVGMRPTRLLSYFVCLLLCLLAEVVVATSLILQSLILLQHHPMARIESSVRHPQHNGGSSFCLYRC